MYKLIKKIDSYDFTDLRMQGSFAFLFEFRQIYVLSLH